MVRRSWRQQRSCTRPSPISANRSPRKSATNLARPPFQNGEGGRGRFRLQIEYWTVLRSSDTFPSSFSRRENDRRFHWKQSAVQHSTLSQTKASWLPTGPERNIRQH